MTLCTDPRCTTTGTCWRAANERYGDAPGENYGPRCVPVPAHALARAYDMGRDKERAAVVAYLAKRGLIGAAEGVREGDHRIERGEHRREEK